MWNEESEESVSDLDTSVEMFATGVVLLLTQNIIVTDPLFSETEIRKYLRLRQLFHPQFVQACLMLCDQLFNEYGEQGQRAIVELEGLSELGPKQVQQALRKAYWAVRALLPMSALRRELHPNLRNVLGVVRNLVEPRKSERETIVAEVFQQAFAGCLKFRSIPAQVKTLFRTLSRLKINIPQYNVESGLAYGADRADPGAWFDMEPVQRVVLRHQAESLTKKQKELVYPSEDYLEKASQIAISLKEVQDTAGVNLSIIRQEDQQSLEDVLRQESKQEANGAIVFLQESTWKYIEAERDYAKGKSSRMTPKEAGKIRTKLRKARTVPTIIRILKEAIQQKILNPSALEDLEPSWTSIQKNKAIREGVPLTPLVQAPMTEEDFKGTFGVDTVIWGDGYTEEQKQKVLGSVGRGLGVLEEVFCKGFCSKHAVPLRLRFEDSAGISSGASASYFAWHNKNHFEPTLTFGEDYAGLLAHEASHYLESLLAYKIQQKESTKPLEFADHDIFMRTGVKLDYFLSLKGKVNAKTHEAFPEFFEFAEAVVNTEDYRRWGDLLGSIGDYISQAIRNITGKDDWDTEFKNWETTRGYKSDFPPEIVKEATRLYLVSSGGDARKLSYHQSGSEIWARSCEQYLYNKLSRAGLIDPWLTHLTYDTDVLPQCMDDKTFTEKIEPILDRLFAKVKSRDILAKRKS